MSFLRYLVCCVWGHNLGAPTPLDRSSLGATLWMCKRCERSYVTLLYPYASSLPPGTMLRCEPDSSFYHDLCCFYRSRF